MGTQVIGSVALVKVKGGYIGNMMTRLAPQNTYPPTPTQQPARSGSHTPTPRHGDTSTIKMDDRVGRRTAPTNFAQIAPPSLCPKEDLGVAAVPIARDTWGCF